jgi:hypothetical protein
MKNEEPLAAQLAAILKLPAGVKDGEIVKAVSELAAGHQAAQASAEFTKRVRALQALTNQSYDLAAATLIEQDRAAK